MDSASSSSSHISLPAAKFDPNSSPNNTTFVETDPSNFKSIVQKLTGADQGKPTSATGDNTHHRGYPFKLLHQRRMLGSSGGNLEIKVRNGVGSNPGSGMERVVPLIGSPVSTLEMMILARGGGGGGSPLTPRSPCEVEEERVIAEKGFYLHPSPLNTPRRNGSDPPELLPLFPLSSPRGSAADDSRTNQ